MRVKPDPEVRISRPSFMTSLHNLTTHPSQAGSGWKAVVMRSIRNWTDLHRPTWSISLWMKNHSSSPSFVCILTCRSPAERGRRRFVVQPSLPKEKTSDLFRRSLKTRLHAVAALTRQSTDGHRPPLQFNHKLIFLCVLLCDLCAFAFQSSSLQRIQGINATRSTPC